MFWEFKEVYDVLWEEIDFDIFGVEYMILFMKVVMDLFLGLCVVGCLVCIRLVFCGVVFCFWMEVFVGIVEEFFFVLQEEEVEEECFVWLFVIEDWMDEIDIVLFDLFFKGLFQDIE